jgi:general secretion pathway protein M
VSAHPHTSFALARQALGKLWLSFGERERLLLGSAGLLLAAAALWWLALAPALATWRSAHAQHVSLDAELMALQLLASEAAALQAVPTVSADESRHALETSAKQRFGASMQLSVIGERATLTLAGASGEAIAGWLAEARRSAKVLPAEARLKLNSERTGWDGTVVLALPSLSSPH